MPDETTPEVETTSNEFEFDYGLDLQSHAGVEEPSAPSPEPGAPTPQAEPQPEVPQPGTGVAPGVVEPASAAAPSAPGLSPEQLLLYEKAKLEGERSALDLARQQLAAAPAAPQPGTPAPAAKFNLQVPNEMVDALRSEDPRMVKAALDQMVNGIAELTYKTAMDDIRQEYKDHFSRGLNEYVQTQMRNAQIYNDFYGTYPELDKPEFHTVVRAVGEKVIQDMGLSGAQWNPTIRDLIGTRTMAMLNLQRKATSPVATPPSPTAKPKPLPTAVVSSTRPAASAPSDGEVIDALLGIT